MRNNYPKIRLSGYETEWSLKKLGDITDVKDSSRISNTLWISNGVPYLRSSDLSNDNIEGELFLSKRTYQEYSAKTGAPSRGDLLFTSGGKIGVTYYKEDDSEVYVQGGSILYAKTSESEHLDGRFLKFYFDTSILKKYIENASTGLTIKHFTLKPAKDTPIAIPDLEEQIKIGLFFKKLDDTIFLHQQELDALKQTKQGFLQKMFPKNGETIPEFRFKEFTNKWNEEILGSIADFSKGSGYSKGDLITEGTPILLYGQLYTNYRSIISSVSSFVSAKEKSVFSAGNEVVVPASGESSEDIARASAITVPGVIIGGDLNIIRPINKIEPIFLALVLSNGKVQRELSKFAQGKSVVHLQNSEIKKVHLTFPEIEEQVKIGEFFRQMDEVIVLKEQELEALKQTKKGFLQKMFV